MSLSAARIGVGVGEAGWRSGAEKRAAGTSRESESYRTQSESHRTQSGAFRRAFRRARGYLHLMSLLLQVEQRGGARISRLHRGPQDALVRIFDGLLHVLDRISIGIATRTGAILLGAATLGGLA